MATRIIAESGANHNGGLELAKFEKVGKIYVLMTDTIIDAYMTGFDTVSIRV